MTLTKYNEWMPTSFSGMLDKFFNESLSHSKLQNFVPQVDVVETDKHYEIHVAVPGMKKEDFKINITDNRITISGERKFSEEKKEKKFHSIETPYGSFSRTFFLPEHANKEAIEANYKEGILEIIIPKDDRKKESTITVK